MEYKGFCAITEVNNSEFHLCKTAISSFISCNQWFDGMLVLINTGDKLSNHNENLLKTIYTKFKIILPNDSKILSKLRKRKDANRRASFLFTHAFDIKSEGNIFFSKTNLFMKEISSILNKERFSIPTTSNIFPDLNYSDKYNYNHNLMFVPKKYISDVNYKKLQKIIIESTSLHTIFGESDIIKKFIREHSISTEYHSNTLIVNSSIFDDSRYSKFIRYHEAIHSLNLDTHFNSGTFNYKRIHNYWKQYNHNLSKGMHSSPVKVKPKNIKISKRSKKNERYRYKINDSAYTSNTFSKKLAIYTTADEKYIKHAIVSFQTFKDINPHLDLDFFILSKNINDNTLELLKKNSISHIELDLTNDFRVENGWPYPSECFWLFKGPEILNELGYKYSMYIDCDIHCNQPMDLSWLDSLDLIAGAGRGTSIRNFLSNVDSISKISRGFNINISEISNNPSINTGVLFFNNLKYSELNFYKKSLDAFLLSKQLSIPRKGDDSLMCLLMAIYSSYSYKILPNTWNNYKFYNTHLKKSANHYNSILIHHYQQKPWNKMNPRFYNNTFVTSFVERWNVISTKLKNDGKI